MHCIFSTQPVFVAPNFVDLWWKKTRVRRLLCSDWWSVQWF